MDERVIEAAAKAIWDEYAMRFPVQGEGELSEYSCYELAESAIRAADLARADAVRVTVLDLMNAVDAFAAAIAAGEDVTQQRVRDAYAALLALLNIPVEF